MSDTGAIDVVGDIIERLARASDVPLTLLHAIERDVRDAWGGQRHYVPKHCDHQRRDLYERTQRIRADFVELCQSNLQPCEARDYLARRYGLSLRRIQQLTAI